MYLSRIKLNTSLKKTMRALVNPNLIHGALDSAEAGERTRKLWRIDTLKGECYLLVLSENRLDLTSVTEQFGFMDSIETKSYDGFLERIVEGSKWRFKIKANPTIKKYDEKKGKSVSLAHITTKHQMSWLLDRALSNGFEITEDSFLVTESKWYDFHKRSSGDNVKLLAVTYEGILTVTDVDLFKKMLTSGIGREKAYGLGMLTIVK